MATRSRKGRARKGGGGQTSSTEGEYRTGPVAGTALISGVTFARKGVLFADVDGLAVVEGDIVLGTVAEVEAAADRAASDPTGAAGAGGLNPVLASIGISGPQFRWLNNTVPYDIEAGLPNQQRITDAIAHWEASTRIRFVLRTPSNAAQFNDFVHFQSGGGCSSMVGRRGGQQNITLTSSCQTGNVIHEIGHAIGLWHEQSREDRDTFIRIEWANIDPAAQHNFSQQITDGDDLGPYDFGSVMHYPPTAFSINGQPTIVARQALPPGVVMGQRNGLSQGDINGVHTMYPQAGGGGITIKETAKDPLRDTIKEITKEPTRDTIKEVRKDPITDTIKEVRKDPTQDTIKEMRKDPLQDTFKEVGKDPIQDTFFENTGIPGPFGPRQPGFFDPNAGASPFVMATPSRVGGGGDVLAEAGAQVQELAQALGALEQQQAELLAAYDEAVQTLDALQQGQR